LKCMPYNPTGIRGPTVRKKSLGVAACSAIVVDNIVSQASTSPRWQARGSDVSRMRLHNQHGRRHIRPIGRMTSAPVGQPFLLAPWFGSIPFVLTSGS